VVKVNKEKYSLLIRHIEFIIRLDAEIYQHMEWLLNESCNKNLRHFAWFTNKSRNDE
jgi:hypothetical protein